MPITVVMTLNVVVASLWYIGFFAGVSSHFTPDSLARFYAAVADVGKCVFRCIRYIGGDVAVLVPSP